jgi:cytochrome c-type biogenesis protein CcmE
MVKKMFVPVMLIVVIAVIYLTYFTQKEGLGSFSDFDTNNNANKDIRVEIVTERGIKKDEVNGATVFYGRDKNGMEVLIQAPLMLPPSFEMNTIVTLRGHLHKEYFHAAEVMVK